MERGMTLPPEHDSTGQITPRERTAKMLSVMAGMGLPADAVSALLEMGGYEQSLDDSRFLRGPVVYGESPWAEDTPKWMFAQVREERVEIAAGTLKMPVGPTEIAVVMYGRTMEAPMPYHMNQLYLWASTHAAARHYGKPVADYWKMLDMRPVEDSDVLGPRGELAHEYRLLAGEIRRKVIAYQTARERGDRRLAKQEAVEKGEIVEVISTEEIAEPFQLLEAPDRPPPQPRARRPPRQPKQSSPSPDQGLFSWQQKGSTQPMKIIAEQLLPKGPDMHADVCVVLSREEDGRYMTYVRNEATSTTHAHHPGQTLPEAWQDFGDRVLDEWPTIDGDYLPEPATPERPVLRTEHSYQLGTNKKLTKPVEIQLIRAEGPAQASIACGELQKAWNYDEANQILRLIAQTVRPKGADKTDFKVTFADGHTYEGRIDVEREDTNRTGILQRHIRLTMQYCCGIWRPDWTKEPRQVRGYEELMLRYRNDGTAQQALEFLGEYDVGQSEAA